jgi:peptide/nickel transport system permease protein
VSCPRRKLRSDEASKTLMPGIRWIFTHVPLALGSAIVLIIAVAAALAPLIAPMDPITQDLPNRLEPPSWMSHGQSAYVLGSDGFGRDVLSRILFGSRVSLAVAGAGIVVSGLCGIVLGLLAGYYEGGLATVVMRFADTQLAFPPILLAVVVVAVFGTSFVNLIIVLAISAWVTYARIVYGQVLSIKHMEYVLAARSIGSSDFRIMSTHILRNAFGAIIVVATLQVGRMILFEAALSFLGMGVPVPAPSWGSMLSEGRNVLAVAPWIATFPGLAIVVTVLGINLLGDGLRELLDPKLRIG